MIDPERLAAFALMTAATSVVPGVSMLFVVGRTIRHSWRSGAAGLAGMQLGYIGWWLLAGLGLGTLAAAFPFGFEILAVGGALYLAWLGLQSIRHAGLHSPIEAAPARPSRGSFRDGVLVGYQLDRSMGHLKPELNDGRSNGCAYADSPGHIPIQRMANVSLMPGTDDLGTDDLISRVERGIYVVGDKSWSIDMQRFNFQFTGQRFYRITDGKLDGMLRDVAYQATTTDFWGSMEAVGGPDTWVLGGAFNCGKAQPGQVAAVSHGCPTALFRGVNILNTIDEAGH